MRVAPVVDGAAPVVCGRTARVLESTTHGARERDRHASVTGSVICRRVASQTPYKDARQDDTNHNADHYQRGAAFARRERVPWWGLTCVDRRRLLRPAKSIRPQYMHLPRAAVSKESDPLNARAKVLITAAELTELIHAGRPMTILDVRWRLDEPDGHAAYLQGHIPGAVYVSLEDELTDHTVAGRGRHPLPSGRNVEACAQRWGIRAGAPTVVYDDWNRAGSARAWWVLTAAGLSGVRILDGGLSAWRSAGGSLAPGPVTPQAGNVTVLHDDLYAGALPTLTAQQADAAEVTLLDARAPERFRGDVEPVDPVAGHIPGAKNLPSSDVLAGDGTFVAEGELDRLLANHGIERDVPVGAYCGSGVTATITLAALATMGYQAALFPGSWSQWSSDPSRPVARGSE
jgi:thiosulfate/3-mercaptopyruvate sulfurtransferase